MLMGSEIRLSRPSARARRVRPRGRVDDRRHFRVVRYTSGAFGVCFGELQPPLKFTEDPPVSKVLVIYLFYYDRRISV